MFPRLPTHATFVSGTQNVSDFVQSETFCVRNKCFPVCAAQETSWATMCPCLPGPLSCFQRNRMPMEKEEMFLPSIRSSIWLWSEMCS